MRPVFLGLVVAVVCGAERFDLAPFARPCCSADQYRLQTTFDYAHPRGVVRAADGRWIYGLQWAEERDIGQIQVRFRGDRDARAAAVEYWFGNWPYDPPKMPTIEDPVDDPWQGRWLKAASKVGCEGRDCLWTFEPLAPGENPRARNLPGVPYRRTIKMRLVFPAGPQPDIEAVAVFSESQVKLMKIRVQFGVDGANPAAGNATFTAYNGRIRRIEPIAKGAVLSIDATDPRPPGSSDGTVVEVHNDAESFAFSPADAEKGPMYIPDFHAYITLVSDTQPFSPSLVRKGGRIRERLAREPEQTYERASREIPPLDPVERQGGRLYMPLAADASWQKFAFEWGGNVAISKSGTKAKGRALARLAWPGDRISWRIGTGEAPTFRPQSADSALSTLKDYLPLVTARWKLGDLEYEEEAFATLLSGPLSSEDPARDEQTPAVLMIRVRARNTAQEPRTSHLWLGMSPAEPLAFSGGLLTAGGGGSVRAAVKVSAGAAAELAGTKDSGRPMPALHISASLGASQDAAAYLALPFIPGLTETERAALRRLDFHTERKRVLGYWSEVTAAGIPFEVPEPRFNSFARGLIARIRISATKDPRSGLYMVPAASYNYQVYANEAVFQCQLLDVTGYRNLAAKYLQTLVELQGSRSFAAEICCSRRRRRSAGSPPDRRSR